MLIANRLSRSVKGTSGQVVFSAGAQLLRYGAPVLFYPLLIRWLTTADFAVFVWCMAAGQIFGQFVEFGFGLIAVRGISEGDSREASAKACGEVIVGKGLMFLLSLVVLSCGSYAFAKSFDLDQVLAVALIGLAYGFTPSWFYAAQKLAHRLALYELLMSFSQLALIVIIVPIEGGVVGALASLIMPVAVLSLFGNVNAVRQLSFTFPSRADLWEAIKSSYNVFVFTNAPTLTNRAIIIALGLASSPAQVAFYSAGERVVSAAINVLAPVMRILLPRVISLRRESSLRARGFAVKALWLGTLLYLSGAVFLALISWWWVPIVFSAKLSDAVLTVSLFLFVMPLSVFGRMTGLLFLVPARRERPLQIATVFTCLVGLSLAYPVASLGAVAAVSLRICIEALIALFAALLSWKYKTESLSDA